jgi:origin recognition complex subunit 5
MILFGDSGSGKTTTLLHVLTAQGCLFATASCISSYTPRLLLEALLAGLGVAEPKCERVIDMVPHLCSLPASRIVYLVLDDAERALEMEGLVAGVVRLAEAVRARAGPQVGVVLVSRLGPEHFQRAAVGLPDLIPVYFGNYPKRTLAEIVGAVDGGAVPPEDLPAFREFTRVAIDVLHNAVRDLSEIRKVIARLFPLYLRPAKEGKVAPDNYGALYTRAEPLLRQAVLGLYGPPPEDDPATALRPDRAFDFELPLYAKYMLIAAYLASHNRAKTDRQYFSKWYLERNKAKPPRRAKGKGKDSDKDKGRDGTFVPYFMAPGPQAFLVERLLAIFSAIVAEPVRPTVDLHVQVSTLATLGFLTRVGSEAGNTLHAPKFKCNVSLERVRALARNIRFPLERYLEEK